MATQEPGLGANCSPQTWVGRARHTYPAGEGEASESDRKWPSPRFSPGISVASNCGGACGHLLPFSPNLVRFCSLVCPWHFFLGPRALSVGLPINLNGGPVHYPRTSSSWPQARTALCSGLALSCTLHVPCFVLHVSRRLTPAPRIPTSQVSLLPPPKSQGSTTAVAHVAP